MLLHPIKIYKIKLSIFDADCAILTKRLTRKARRFFVKKKKGFQWSVALLFPAVLFYYETVFKYSTGCSFFQTGTWYLLLFCLAYGGFGYLLSTLSHWQKWNRRCALVLILLGALPYLIEYFIFRQFKVFYDLNTMFGGAGDALSSYSHEITRMIFTWTGIGTILLFLLPSILYFFFGWRIASPRQSNARTRIFVVVCAIAVYLFSVLGISLHSTLSLTWEKQYDFQSAVDHFGLLTGISLDIREALFGSSGGSFELDATTPNAIPVPTGTQSTDSSESTESPIVYTPNQLDIDFSSLEATGQIADLNAYVASLSPSMKNEYTGLFAGKNLILITAEAFTLEVIDPELTPTLYRLATKGINFTDYYMTASSGTTGGEYQVVFGMVPTDGGMSFKNTADNLNYFTMGSQLDRLGYYGKAFHNHSYTYYSRDITHNNIGYSDGFMGYGNGMEKYVSNSWPQSDLEMFQGTVPTYIGEEHFNVYYMTVSGHSSYSVSGNSMSRKNWDRVAHLSYSDTVKSYLAAQLELEDALRYLVGQLEAKGIADDTVICLSADHFPYGLDDEGSLGNFPYLSELYGYDVETVFQRDHNGLIIWCGELEDSAPIIVDSPVGTIDILPTLSNLFGLEYDSRLFPGRDALSDTPALVFNATYDWKTDYGTYYASSGTFVPTDPSVELPDGYVGTVQAIVRNKMRYCELVLDNDYFAYLFSE